MPYFEWRENNDRFRYHYLDQGEGSALLLCHGFTGSSQNWLPLLPTLTEHRRIIALDLPGHGATHLPSDEAYTMARAVQAVERLLDHLALPQIDLLGYSMGGRFALSFACSHPIRIRRLILESASPGLPSASDRAARKQSDDTLAQRIEADGIGWFVDTWEQLPLWASQQQLPYAVREALRQARLRNEPTGLANSLRHMGTGVMPPLWDCLPRLAVPTLLLVGELDAKFRQINTEMHATLPQSTLRVISGAGHTIHLEQISAYLEVVNTFLQQT